MMIKKNVEEENKNRKEEKKMDKKLEKLEQELEELQKQLREKEQENRISTMKIRQYKRTIKQAKLKPMEVVEENKDKAKEHEKERNFSKPKQPNTDLTPIQQQPKNSSIKKQPTKPAAVEKVDSSTEQVNKNQQNKSLGGVKAPAKDGKGTFETEVHL